MEGSDKFLALTWLNFNQVSHEYDAEMSELICTKVSFTTVYHVPTQALGYELMLIYLLPTGIHVRLDERQLLLLRI